MAKVARIPPVGDDLQCDVCARSWDRRTMLKVLESFDAERTVGRRKEIMRVRPGDEICVVHAPRSIVEELLTEERLSRGEVAA